MARVYLMQLLCKQRHAILALAWEEGQHTPAEIREMLSDAARVLANPWCGLCGTMDLHFEYGRTSFMSLKEAEPQLRQVEMENLQARQLLGRFHRGGEQN